MDQLRICFNGHFGGKFEDSNIVLYESSWNDFGYHGLFEFQIVEETMFNIKGTKWLHICRIDGTMKKRHELCNRYDRNVSKLPQDLYISFPSEELCIKLLLNYPLETRKKIAEALCFNFGDDSKFKIFKRTEQYRKSALRGITEEDFLTGLKRCKEILYCEIPLSELLSKNEIDITHKSK